MNCTAYSNGSGAPILIGGTLPAEFCHDGNWGNTFLAFIQAMVAALPGNYAGLVVGDDTPSASDRDKLWYRTSTTCQPLGLFVYYNGKWKRAVPHHLPPGSIIDYWSSSFHASDHDANARTITYLDVYDETYSAIIDSADPFWRVCDGTNGTPDLRGRVRVGAGDNPDPNISNRLWGAVTGAESIVLGADQIPTISSPIGTSGGTGGFVQGSKTGGSIALNAGGGSHPNMQPSLMVYPIMRTTRTV